MKIPMSPSADPSCDVTPLRPIRLVVLFWFLWDNDVLQWHRTTVRRQEADRLSGGLTAVDVLERGSSSSRGLGSGLARGSQAHGVVRRIFLGKGIW